MTAGSQLQETEIRQTVLFRKVYGSIMGGAVGDALGGPVEGMHYKLIRQLYNGRVETLVPYDRPDDFFQPGHLAYALTSAAGSYTDDTRLQLLITKAIVEKHGRIDADDLADLWMKDMNVKAFWHSVSAGFHRIALSKIPVREAGRGNIQENSSAMCIGPIGVINAGNPAQAAMDAYDVASLSHEDYAREAACVIAAAVAEAMRPGTTVQNVVDATLKHMPNRDTNMFRERIKLAIELADRAKDTEELTALCYGSLNVKWEKRSRQAYGADKDNDRISSSADPLEAVPVALAMFYKCGGDYKATVMACANYGRDCDTIACMAGYIAGAYGGCDSIPEEWLELVAKNNPDDDICDLSVGVCRALWAEKARMEENVNMLQKMNEGVIL